MRLNQHSPATSIYLEQMGNHIELGQGYNQLRKHLFRQLFHSSQEAASEDRLSESIVSFLTASLSRTVNFHKSEQTYRIVQIVEDLITYAQEIMSPAMHQEQFVSSLVYAATPKIVTFNTVLDTEIRNHILSLFYFWFNRYGRDEEGSYQIFIAAYKDLKDKKLVFPTNIKITPSDYFKKELQKTKGLAQPEPVSSSQVNKIVLADIQEFTVKTENLMKENIRTVANTEYVRLIKHKSKVLYEFTTKPNEFTTNEKNLVKDLYKRLRTILKEVEKVKEVTLQTKRSEQTEKQYVEQKMTPKKSGLEDSPEQPKSQKQVKPLLSPAEKKSSEKQVQIVTFDLLDFSGSTSLQAQEQPKAAIAPKKSSEKANLLETDLLGGSSPFEQQQEFVDGILVDTSETMSKPEQQKALFQVFLTPKKHSNEEDATLLAKHSSEKSDGISVSFQNQKKSKNNYQFIPNDLNLTPTSSNEEKEEKVQQKQGFSLFGLLSFGQSKQQEQFDSDDEKHYDLAYKKEKSSSNKTPEKPQFLPADLVNESDVPLKNPIDSPSYRPIAPVIYEQQNYCEFSPQKSEEQSKLSSAFQKVDAKQEELDLEITIGNKSGEKIKLAQE